MRTLPLVLLLAFAAPAVQARPAMPPVVVAAPSWGQLSPKQQADLAWLERDWDGMEYRKTLLGG